MDSILYCGVCTMPPEYCRYHPKYDKCLEWMKTNQPDLFAIEIKDLSQRDPKTAKKTKHLWDENAASPEEQKSNDNNIGPKKSKRKRGRKSKQKRSQQQNDDNNNNNNNNNNNEQFKETKQVKIMEDEVIKQQQIANDQIADMQSKLNALDISVGSPSKSILKNRENPNFEQEKQNLNASQINSDDNDDNEEQEVEGQYLGRRGNMNKARGPPPRKLTKQKKRKKKKGGKGGKRDRKRGGRGNNEEEQDENDENKENKENDNNNNDNNNNNNNDKEEEESRSEREKRVKFEAMRSSKKIPKNIVEVQLDRRKGNKKVTVVRGFIEKSKDKEQRIQSEFRKKFATSVNITFQNPGCDKGPKQLVLMGDKRYDFMKYLKDKFPKASKLLYYKSKKFGLTPAVDPDHGFIMPPP